MIGYFPQPQKDELLYSLCARFVKHLDIQSYSSTMKILFGTQFAAPIVELPNNLDHLASSLPPVYELHVDTLIDCHTLLPLYAPFLTSDMYRDVRLAMKSGRRSTCLKRGVVCERVSAAESLRYCGLCFEEDLENLGQSYWRRGHQIMGVEICLRHQVFLLKSDVSVSNQWNAQNFTILEPSTLKTDVVRPDFTNSEHQIICDIAEDLQWITDQSGFAGLLPEIQRKYAQLLRQQGMVAISGNVIWEHVHTSFVRHFSASVFKTFHIDPTDANLIPRLIWPEQRIASPALHALFMRYLGESAESFFTELETALP